MRSKAILLTQKLSRKYSRTLHSPKFPNHQFSHKEKFWWLCMFSEYPSYIVNHRGWTTIWFHIPLSIIQRKQSNEVQTPRAIPKTFPYPPPTELKAYPSGNFLPLVLPLPPFISSFSLQLANSIWEIPFRRIYPFTMCCRCSDVLFTSAF